MHNIKKNFLAGRTFDTPVLVAWRFNGYGRLNFRDVPPCLEQVEEETSATKKKNFLL